MFNKSVFLSLGIISILWIGYVSLSVVDFSVEPKPESVFSLSDNEIVVIHKTSEIDFTDLRIKNLEKEDFYLQLLAQPERVQHFYFSTSRKLVLLERSKAWTFDIIENYAQKLNLGATFRKTDKKVQFSNGWKGYYSDNFFYLSAEEIKLEKSKTIEWNYLDKNASSSVLSLEKNKQYNIENAYFINGKTIAYSSHTNAAALPLVNDQEVFQELIPIDFSEYEFFENAYLKRTHSKDYFFSDWMNYGLAKITKDKQTCFVIDFKTGAQPLESICDFLKMEHSNEKKLRIKNADFPFNLSDSEELIVEIHKNFVFVSSSQSLINNLIGNYEIGNTLAQASSKCEKFFSKTPQKVSYRKLNANFTSCSSALEKSLHRVQVRFTEESVSEEDAKLVAQLSPIRLDGQLVSLFALPNSSQIASTSASNSLSLSSKERILWTKSFTGTQIGEIQYNSIGSQLAISHENGILWMNSAGTILLEQELTAVSSSPALFTWKGESCIGVIANGGFVYFNSKGKQVQRISLSGNLTAAKIALQVKKGELLVHIVSANEWICLNANRQRIVFRKNLGEGDWFLSKQEANMLVYGMNKKQFIRYTENGAKSMLVGNCSKVVHSQTTGKEYFGLLQGQSVYVIQANTGTILTQFKTTLKQIDDLEIQQNRNGKLIVGLIDGIANNCYLYKLNGTELSKQSYEGSGKIALQNTNEGTLILASQANGYLVRYPILN